MEIKKNIFIYDAIKFLVCLLIVLFVTPSCGFTGEKPVFFDEDGEEEKEELALIIPEKLFPPEKMEKDKRIDKKEAGIYVPEIKEGARLHKVYWGNIHVGDLVAEIKKENSEYVLNVAMRSYNLAKLISKYKADVSGKIKQGDNNYIQSYYKCHYERRKDDRNIELIYNSDGTAIEKETNTPPEKRWKRKEVPVDKKNNSWNPISIAFEARRQIIDAVRSNTKEFKLPLYDGRRRGDYSFRINGMTKDHLIEVVFTEEAVSGYTDNELKEMAKGKNEITLYLSTEDYWPVRAKGRSPLGRAVAKLEKTCGTMQECMK